MKTSIKLVVILSLLMVSHFASAAPRLQMGADFGYQVATQPSGGAWSGSNLSFGGPMVVGHASLLWPRGGGSALGVQLRGSYSGGSGTFTDGEGFNPGGGSGESDVEYAMSGHMATASALFMMEFGYLWGGVGLGVSHGWGSYEGDDGMNEPKETYPELVAAAGLRVPVGEHLEFRAGLAGGTAVFSNRLSANAGVVLRF